MIQEAPRESREVERDLERERHSVQSLSQCSRKEGKRHQERPRTMRFLLFFVNKVQRNELNQRTRNDRSLLLEEDSEATEEEGRK